MARSHPVDVHVGARMRQRRTLLGMSQEKLGNAVGLTFQQIQKYERGSNRIGSSRLFEFAKVLDVPVSYFFDEMPSNALAGRPMSGRGKKGFGEAATPFEQEKDPLCSSPRRSSWSVPITRSARAVSASASSRWSRPSVRPATPKCWAAARSASR
jgi:transcriptional regulator with XRE-family HTH domain